MTISTLARAAGARATTDSLDPEALAATDECFAAEAQRIDELLQRVAAQEASSSDSMGGSTEFEASANQASARIAELEAKTARCEANARTPGTNVSIAPTQAWHSLAPIAPT